MAPYFIFKDLITIFVFLLVYSILVFYFPNALGDTDNYIEGNPLVTPAAIKKITPYYNSESKYSTDKDLILKELNRQDDEDEDNSKFDDEDFRQLSNGLFQAEGHVGCEFLDVKRKALDLRPVVFVSLNSSLESIKYFKRLNKVFDNKLHYNIYLLDSNIYHIKIYSRNWDLIFNKIMPYFNNTYGDKARGFLALLKIKSILDLINSNKIKKYSSIWMKYHIKVIYLVYNMVDNSQRSLNLHEYINMFINNNKSYINDFNIDHTYYNKYVNTILNPELYNKLFTINKLFILGFFLGDGSFTLSIRESTDFNKVTSLPWYIGLLRIYQKNTTDNIKLLNIMKTYLIKYNIDAKVVLRDNSDKKNYYVLLYIEDSKSFIKIGEAINNYTHLFYTKKSLLYLLINYTNITKLTKHWRLANLIILRMIKEYKLNQFLNHSNDDSKKYEYYTWEELKNKYPIFNVYNNKSGLDKDLKIVNDTYKFPVYLSNNSIKLCFTNFYEDKINFAFDINEHTPLFIYKQQNKEEYYVKLPFYTKPNTKYFSFKTYITKENALNAAILYRDNMINQWVLNNNYFKYI